MTNIVDPNQTVPVCVLDLKLEWGTVKLLIRLYMSLIMRKPGFCKCENKDADQLQGNREADQ